MFVKHGHTHPTRTVRLREASHPIPDESCVNGTADLVGLLDTTGPRDLVVVVLSGGGSALMLLPAEGISLADMQQTTDALLRVGATINELNTIRKHLERAKGGGLARLAAPSDVLALVLSDVVGNPLDVIASGPTVPDTSTFADTCAIVERFGIWDKLPERISSRLRDGREAKIADTPKPGDPLFERVQTVVVAMSSNFETSALITSTLKKLGIPNVIAKSNTDRHREILLRIGADRVILPEEESGYQLADELSIPGMLEILRLSPDYSLIEIKTPPGLRGKGVEASEPYGVVIVLIVRGEELILDPDQDCRFTPEDILVVVGEKRRLAEFSSIE